MKQKILTLFIVLFSTLSLTANTNNSYQYYKAYQYSQRYVTDSGYWTSWSAWKQVNINITFDLTNDVIWIFSAKTQKYSVYSSDIYYDSDGEKVLRFYFVDQDGDKGHMRLMIRPSGTSQIYIDFSNMSWCYNVVRK